ncbi:3-oxoacyl-ACP synthase III family protein [Micromonospora sp. NPDC050187]|uniref:3-oxoacyl-ACP synthase III family protein n=1 Tax=Micromonospora sp. NPDC050187 TaxID=3364277 RepID=UPI00379C75B0
MSFGIAGMGYALGEPRSVAEAAPGYTDDLRRVRDWGYETFHRAADGVGLTDLAATAGREALARSGIDPEQVDLVVLAMADVPEHLYWDPAAATQAKVGAHRAEALLVNQACSSGVMSFDAVAGKYATHPDYKVTLLVAANRVCEAYWNRMESSTAVTSDGAVAAVLVRDHPACRWLATEIRTDGRYADFARLALGGAAAPFVAGGPAPPQMGDPAELMTEFLGGDVRAVIRFARYTRDNSRAVMEAACRRGGVPVRAVRHILHMNGTSKGLEQYARDFGVDLANTNATIARTHGHFGSADQLLALGRMLDEGRLASGDVVALSSTGNGMHWACTLLRV